MKIDKINYKITTSEKLNCHKCKKIINGKEGYIKTSFGEDRGYNPLHKDTSLRICWDCFITLIKDCEKGRETRKEDYTRLLKQRILIGLR